MQIPKSNVYHPLVLFRQAKQVGGYPQQHHSCMVFTTCKNFFLVLIIGIQYNRDDLVKDQSACYSYILTMEYADNKDYYIDSYNTMDYRVSEKIAYVHKIYLLNSIN